MNKGFQALPDYVQRKIDPEAAEKFMGGGSVMQRPLFRQAGGPAEADMAQMAAMGQQFLMPEAQQPMAPQQVDPQQAAMVQAQEQHNMEDGQKVGEMYASEMMNRLDAAEDPKSMIDAFRGNEKPLEARYTELAGFVGEADAQQTPESVLAMVQPTIMMTEEGAVDSGIGELMQGLVQSVEMEDDSQMAQGVGELMAMGAGNTPPVNFNQGGPVMVRKFQTGTPPGGPKAQEPVALDLGTSLMPYYEEAQGIRRGILGTPQERATQLEEQKRLTQAQMLFDIAQAGLQFAGSTDGRSVAERLANSLSESQLAPKIGERAAQFQQMKDVQKQQEQQMDLSALDSAERQLAGAQGRAFEMNKLAQENLNRINLTEIEIGARKEAATSEEELRKALQTEKLNLEEKLANLKITATAAENSKDRSAQVLAASQLAAAQKQLATLNASLKVGNDLKVLGAKNNFELAKIENAQDFEFAVINKKAAIDRVAAQSDRNFQAAQNSLSRIATQFENQKDRDFRSEESLLRREFDEKIKNLDLTEAEKDRALKHADMMITKAFEEHRLLQGDEKLTLEKLKMYFDQDYKNEELALKKQESELKASTSGLMKFTIKDADGNITQTIAAIGSTEGQALQEQVNEANLREEGSAEAKKVGTESVNPQAYITNQGNIITSYDNNTFVETDAQGNPVMKLLKDVEAKSLGDSDVYSTIKKQKIINYGKERLEEATSYLDTKVYVGTDNKPLPAEQQQALRKLEKETVTNLYGDITEKDVRAGTGFFSNLFALANNIGGTIAPEFFSKTFATTEEARLALERFNLIAVSALTVNPRLAVYDIQRVERILPKATNLLKNPATEAKKFKELVTTMKAQRSRLLTAIRDEDPVALENIGQTMAKIRELDGVLAMVRITDSTSSKSLSDALGQTEDQFE
jgi:hypothetical protein